ncbi:SDR family oxidoreductase [Massilia sp. IC2-476]|uniref:SDR family oxidoreductase n=1 Tax=Massilia sp. IC2-476 TaxID=2887199 RepID=UPI001D11CAEE|nr:SDR family oxidoreductase [Massilia sp. IC2-476]MCC2970395.1 SDR family oxidoreductase [Massilia sp. IC2-476]
MKLSNFRVVIMGASSGIGAATAIAFAREGAQLVLGARGKEGLDEVVRRCRQAGGEAEALVVDAIDADAVAGFARKARSSLGRIDLWFSCVGAGAVGKYAEVPMLDHRRVIETNLLTHMNDAHAVLPIFLEQDQGIWVNMISAGGYVASPFAAAYSASKFGLRGFSESLRAELGKRPRIHVCDVYPTFVDTPGFRHGANYTGAKLSYPPGVLKPETVADAVVDLARNPRPSTGVGAPVAMFRLSNFAAPNLIASSMNYFLDRWAKRAERVPDTRGALYEPQHGFSGIRSGERRVEEPRNSALVLGAVALGAVVGMGLLRKR